MKYSCIIWDWNGTLADDAEASRLAVNELLLRHEKLPITMEQYYQYIDTPIERFYAHLFDLREISMDTIGQEFYEFYPRFFTALHSGAEDVLRALQETGVAQVILTSGNRQVIHGDTTRFGIRQYFDEILGADDLLAAGKVERGLQWIRNQAISPGKMVMIGDTLHDYDVAHAMGTDCILFSGGHQAKGDLEQAGVPVIDSLKDLYALL